MGKLLCRIQLKFRFWSYKKRWHTSWKFQFQKINNKKVIAKSLWQTYMKWTVHWYSTYYSSTKSYVWPLVRIDSNKWLNKKKLWTNKNFRNQNTLIIWCPDMDKWLATKSTYTHLTNITNKARTLNLEVEWFGYCEFVKICMLIYKNAIWVGAAHNGMCL